LAPLQPPDAVHDVARVLDLVSVLLPPALMVRVLADSDTVGLRENWAWAGEVAAAKMTARADSARRMDGFMGGDDRHNVVGTVCLQTATC
jgi:hypothetical protein